MQSRSNFALSTRCRLAHSDTRDYGRDRQASVVAGGRSGKAARSASRPTGRLMYNRSHAEEFLVDSRSGPPLHASAHSVHAIVGLGLVQTVQTVQTRATRADSDRLAQT